VKSFRILLMGIFALAMVAILAVPNDAFASPGWGGIDNHAIYGDVVAMANGVDSSFIKSFGTVPPDQATGMENTGFAAVTFGNNILTSGTSALMNGGVAPAFSKAMNSPT